MPKGLEYQKQSDTIGQLVDAALKAGAQKADGVIVRSGSTSLSVRLGKVENSQSAQSDDVALRVFVDGRVASVSATSGYDCSEIAQRAVAMAKVSPRDPFQDLAPQELLAQDFPDLDLFDETTIDSETMRETALEMEESARAIDGVTNSGGAGVSFGSAGIILVTSHGFSGVSNISRFSRSVSVLAGEGTAMERDYDFATKVHYQDLPCAAQIGRNAGERAVKRLNARSAKTGPVSVIFDPRVARGFAGCFASAINGASVARKTSFLRDMMGKQVANSAITITDNPLRKKGLSSRVFDGEGVRGEPLTMIEKGQLNHWLLSHSVARELNMQTNGRGSRSGSSVSPSASNFAIEPGEQSPQSMISSLENGFYVTEMIGQGVNMVTGDFSRGASGFWIENGELSFPVSGVTLASNLKDMFMSMVPANDLDREYSISAPTLYVEGMTLAGS